MSTITPHKLGVHKILKHIPLNAMFDAPAKRRLAKAVNIADLRLCAKARAHKVSLYHWSVGTNDVSWYILKNVLLFSFCYMPSPTTHVQERGIF